MGICTRLCKIGYHISNGGIYLDTDVEVTKKFDDLLKDESFMGFNDNSDVALGLGFGQ